MVHPVRLLMARLLTDHLVAVHLVTTIPSLLLLRPRTDLLVMTTLILPHRRRLLTSPGMAQAEIDPVLHRLRPLMVPRALRRRRLPKALARCRTASTWFLARR